MSSPRAGQGPRAVKAWNFAKLVLGVALVLVTATGTAWGAYHLAVTSPRFAVTELKVEGTRTLSDSAVAKLAGIGLGENLLALDVGATERRLVRSAWIQSARVSRALPSTLRIVLVEREARALVEIGAQLFLVDALGEPFKAWSPGDPYELPVITGVSLENWARDREGARERVATGLKVLDQYSRLEASTSQVAQELHLAPNGALSLTVGTQGLALELGTGPWDKKMLRAENILRTFERERNELGVVFLDNAFNPSRVVVRMR